MVLHLNKWEEQIPIGIASSVAASHGFSWHKCIEIAIQLNISVIQLYLSQFEPEFDWHINQSKFQQIYLHLPPDFNQSHPIINSFKNLHNMPILIQHKQYLQKKDIAFFKERQLPLGFENDQDNVINGYHKSLKTLMDIGLRITAVIDFPRFFHQFYKKHSEQVIFEHVIDILLLCKNNNIPIILHAIDIANYDPGHSNWVPIFSGILSWTKLLTFVLEESIPVKSIVFEYEDIKNTEKSVYSLREWFKKL